MGGTSYSETRTVSEKFLTWFNGLFHPDYATRYLALKELRKTCKEEMQRMRDDIDDPIIKALHEEDDINEAEAETSAP